MKVGRRTPPLIFALLAFSLALGSLAWACTQQGQVTLIPPGPVPAGSPVKVTGSGFAPGHPVEIRWNSPEGAVLATAQGPSFSTSMKVPADAPASVYYVMAVQTNVPGPLGMTLPTSGASAPLGVKTATSTRRANDSGNADGGPEFRVSPALWEGFEPGRNAGVFAAPSTTEGSNTGSIGLALLALGTSGVFAAGVLATVRKRRVTASTGR